MTRLVATFDAGQLRDLANIDGLYVGSLGKEDMRLFEDAVEAGLAYHSYGNDALKAFIVGPKVKVGQP